MANRSKPFGSGIWTRQIRQTKTPAQKAAHMRDYRTRVGAAATREKQARGQS